jgi:hypothetical protein
MMGMIALKSVASKDCKLFEGFLEIKKGGLLHPPVIFRT